MVARQRGATSAFTAGPQDPLTLMSSVSYWPKIASPWLGYHGLAREIVDAISLDLHAFLQHYVT